MKTRFRSLLELEAGILGIIVAAQIIATIADYGARVWRLLY